MNDKQDQTEINELDLKYESDADIIDKYENSLIK
jgi:hypothetical protein